MAWLQVEASGTVDLSLLLEFKKPDFGIKDGLYRYTIQLVNSHGHFCISSLMLCKGSCIAPVCAGARTVPLLCFL